MRAFLALIAACTSPKDSALTDTGETGVADSAEDSGEAHTWDTSDTGYAQVSPGGGFSTCAVRRNGTLMCFGRVIEGDTPDGHFVQVTIGSLSRCAIDGLGEVLCWGESTWGELDSPEGQFTEVAEGAGFVCGLAIDGSVECWGTLPGGTSAFTFPGDACVDIDSGYHYGCGITVGGAIECWNTDLGEVPSVKDPVSLGCGSACCAVSAAGDVACWGGVNEFGELNPPVGEFAQVDGGTSFFCGLTTGGEIVCWGRSSEAAVSDAPSEGTFVYVGVGGQTACAITADAELVCWGSNAWGQASPP